MCHFISFNRKPCYSYSRQSELVLRLDSEHSIVLRDTRTRIAVDSDRLQRRPADLILKLFFRGQAQHHLQGDPRTAVESDRMQRRPTDLI